MEIWQKIETTLLSEYIEEIFDLNTYEGDEIENARYHHNANYEKAPSILKNNILSIRRLYERGAINLSQQQLYLLDDILSHANGTDGISLSVVGLKDLYKDEFEYNPFNPKYMDYIISSDIKAQRYTTNYGNEYIAKNEISLSDIKSIDFRLIEYIKSISLRETDDYNDIIKKYNTLLYVTKKLVREELPIVIREMSSTQKTFDIVNMSKNPYLVKVKK